GSDEKVRYLVDELGLDAAFNYKGEHGWRPQLGALSPFGIDVYFDNVGGRVSDIIFPYLNTGARVAVCAQISEPNREPPSPGPRWLVVIREKRASGQGCRGADFGGRYADALHNLSAWLRGGWLTYRGTIEDGRENAPRAFIGMLEG